MKVKNLGKNPGKLDWLTGTKNPKLTGIKNENVTGTKN